MARHRRPVPEMPPEQLCRFVVDEWVPGDPGAGLGLWKEARRAYVAEHGDRTALGDLVDLLQGEIEAKRLLAGGTPYVPVAEWFGEDG